MVSSASRQSLDTTISSAARGQPRRPSRSDQAPSCICAPSVMLLSWQWSRTTRSNMRAYSSARRMISLFWTPEVVSVTAATPAFRREPSGARALPSWPFVKVPAGSTRTTASREQISRSSWMVPTLSAAGSESGIVTTVVKPPAAAARVPVRTVSRAVRPGSPSRQFRSTKPGAATRPRPSTMRALAWSAAASLSTKTPSTAKMSPTASSRPEAGSITRAPRIQRGAGSERLIGRSRRCRGGGRPCARRRRCGPVRGSRNEARPRPRFRPRRRG